MLPSSVSGGTAIADLVPARSRSHERTWRTEGDAMTPPSLAGRVVTLEQQMNALQQLPTKVDDLALQVSQLHAEMTREFSAIRAEMAAESAAVRAEMTAESAAVRAEMAAEFATVRAEMAEGDAETRRQMRVLHEDLVNRIALLHEGLSPVKARRSRRRRR
jgi:hypothetical protein